MYNRRLKVSTAILAGLSLLCAVSPAPAQFGFSIVSDPTQEAHSLKQLVNDIQKLQKLDQQIQLALAMSNQLQASARFFLDKSTWKGLGNQIVWNWAPNAYGITPAWNSAVLFGIGAPAAWLNSTVALQRNPYLAQIAGVILAGGHGYNPYAHQVQYASAVEVFDGAGPTALQTLGNTRVQQQQMATSIANLQTASADTSDGTNSEVEQLNLLTAGPFKVSRCNRPRTTFSPHCSSSKPSPTRSSATPSPITSTSRTRSISTWSPKDPNGAVLPLLSERTERVQGGTYADCNTNQTSDCRGRAAGRSLFLPRL
jgi:hypothetical protein